MRAARRRTLAVDLTWLLALVAVFATLWQRPDTARADADSLKRRLDQSEAILESSVAVGISAERSRKAEQRTADWQTMTASESLRIAELSRAAREAEVAIVSLRDRERESAEGPTAIRARSHAVRVLGSYRQLAQFLANVADSRGLVSVEDLIIEPDDSNTQGLLRASLTVSWHSSDPDAKPSPGEEPAG